MGDVEGLEEGIKKVGRERILGKMKGVCLRGFIFVSLV